MKIKTLEWEELDSFSDTISILATKLPQIFMQIRPDWNYDLNCSKRNLFFYHGYTNDRDNSIFSGTVDECKEFAQKYFENYIIESYFEKD